MRTERYRRRRQLKRQARKAYLRKRRAEFERKWRADGGIMGYLERRFPPEEDGWLHDMALAPRPIMGLPRC